MISAKEHKERHEMLHEHLDELVDDFITHTKGLPSQATVFELMQWSAEQVKNPDPEFDEVTE